MKEQDTQEGLFKILMLLFLDFTGKQRHVNTDSVSLQNSKVVLGELSYAFILGCSFHLFHGSVYNF